MILYLNCDKEPWQVSYTKADYLLAAAARLGMGDRVKMYRGEENPEYILNVEPFYKFTTGTKWTGIWEIDLLCDRYEMTVDNWQRANTVFIAISTIPPNRLDTVKDKTRLLFQAADPVIHKRTLEPDFDFVFCGTFAGGDLYAERERIMNKLKSQYSFKNFGKEFTPVDYAANLSHGRVQVIRSMAVPFATGELAQRFFESLAIGPVLTNYVDDLTRTGLVEGEDYFSYKNDEELLEKMELLIKNPDLAAQVGKKGREKALMYHTYDQRLMSIFNIINYE